MPNTATPQANTETVLHRIRSTLPQPAPGGGSGQLWADASSKASRCTSHRYYGKTKRGSCLTEVAA